MISIKVILFIVLCLSMGGCTSLSYYAQSVRGHTALMLARKPIDTVIETADESLKKKLLTAIKIRRFAVTELGLPDNGSYTAYVQLKNDPPIWNVIAASEFSLKAQQWCYPVIGCASYRGYYHREDAERYAAGLEKQGYEVHLSSATAYSTLGWFEDPLTSAMLNRGEVFLAELMFHELAHQQLYVNNDSRFNEAFASAVGEQGAIRWLEAHEKAESLKQYQERLIVRDDFLLIVNEAKKALAVVYSSDMSDIQKRAGKQKVFLDMREAYKKIKKEKWNGRAWYSNWFSKPINNARLASISTYRDLVPAFTQLFKQCDMSFPSFYRAVKKVSETESKDLKVMCL